METVNGRPADWFQRDQIPVLEAYCRHVAYAAALSGELNQVEPEWLRDPEGLKRHQTLLNMHQQETRAVASLATKMRLTQQAMYETKTASRKNQNYAAGRKPWQVDAE